MIIYLSCAHDPCSHKTDACCWFCNHADIIDFQCNDCVEIGEVECSQREGNPRTCRRYKNVETDHFTLVNIISPNDIEYYIKGLKD